MYHIFIHLSVDGHLGCFHEVAIVNSAAMNIGVHVSFQIMFFSGYMEKEMATHSSILAWKIPWMEEPGRLQSKGSQRVRHDWVTSLSFSCLGVGLQGHIVALFSFFRNLHTVLHSGYTNLHSHQQSTGKFSSLHILSSIFLFVHILMMAFLTGVYISL